MLWALALLSGCGGETEPPAVPQVVPAPAPAPLPEPPRAVAAPVTVKRIYFSTGRSSGSEVTTTSADGTVTDTYDVLENGRGPHVEAKIRVDGGGVIASLEAKGHHTMGTPIEETFSREGGHASYHSHEERGEVEASPSAFFLPMAPLPVAYGLLASALLKAGGTLPLLPGGEAHLEKIGDLSIAKGAEARHVTGYAIYGTDLVATYVWMNDDGSWFGNVDAWSSIVPEGWDGAIKPLVDLQDGYDRKHDAVVAARLARKPPPAGVALVHARVLDVQRGRWIADQTIVVVGDRIASVGPSRSAKVPGGAEVVDLAGKALLPGLWDMHSHLDTADGALDIASGVTTARDVGNDPDKLDDWKKRYDDGTAIGPHVFRMGFIEGRGEKAASSRITAETVEEAKAAVAFYAARGYDGMKIYNSIRPELIPIITKEAHARGMSVTGHIPVHVLAREAVEQGYDGIEHVNMLFLNFFATHETDTRDTTRFTLVGEKAASLDLKSKPVTDFFALLREKKTVIDPTVDAFEDLLVGKQGQILPDLEPMVRRLPVQVARGFLLGGLPRDGKDDLYARSYDQCLAMVKALADAKVTVVAGTDELAGLMLHHEPRALRAGRRLARRRDPDGDDRARARDEEGQGERLDRQGQGRRSRRRGRRSARAHRRYRQGRDHDEGGRRLPLGAALRLRRRRAVPVASDPALRVLRRVGVLEQHVAQVRLPLDHLLPEQVCDQRWGRRVEAREVRHEHHGDVRLRAEHRGRAAVEGQARHGEQDAALGGPDDVHALLGLRGRELRAEQPARGHPRPLGDVAIERHAEDVAEALGPEQPAHRGLGERGVAHQPAVDQRVRRERRAGGDLVEAAAAVVEGDQARVLHGRPGVLEHRGDHDGLGVEAHREEPRARHRRGERDALVHGQRVDLGLEELLVLARGLGGLAGLGRLLDAAQLDDGRLGRLGGPLLAGPVLDGARVRRLARGCGGAPTGTGRGFSSSPGRRRLRGAFGGREKIEHGRVEQRDEIVARVRGRRVRGRVDQPGAAPAAARSSRRARGAGPSSSRASAIGVSA